MFRAKTWSWFDHFKTKNAKDYFQMWYLLRRNIQIEEREKCGKHGMEKLTVSMSL
jgi:hypothetical protein